IPAPKKHPPEKSVEGVEPRVGVFVCHCGTNIAGVVNVPEVVEYAKTLANVVWAQNFVYACSNDTQETIKKLIAEHDLNRVIVASCSPRTHEALFRKTMPEAGLNPYLFEMANIRDQCSWVHIHEPQKATRKAKDLVRIAVAKARLLEPLKKKHLGVTRSALVVGGGASGLTAALGLARQGLEVHLVEKEMELGGHLRKLNSLLSGENPKNILETLIKDVKEQSNIHVYKASRVTAIEGSLGNFKSTITLTDGRKKEIRHGAVIVAVGARESAPTEYLFGQNPKVVTQLAFEELLKDPDKIKNLKSVVFIQCVGSREPSRPYCSRICCTQAIKNSLKIKELNPKAEVAILYRDIRTYGFKEAAYRRAREAGVLFVRYDETEKPKVAASDRALAVSLKDPVLGLPLELEADLVVLSAATIPHPENNELAQMLKVPLNQDKFFLEAHMKLRPVDFATDGVYLCGMAHLPKLLDESIAQALAVSSRAATVLSKETIELEPTVSSVTDENCDGCAYCVDPCPYKAITLLEYMSNGVIKKIVEVNESLCKGCGVCMATCPKRGITVRGFRLVQLAAMVEAALTPAPLTEEAVKSQA
ncbi:MAG: CoB--CoM heterodisulfide reductase iron-sulfur subunit A family protein, partial [Elusimicrobia bacterium]|nr:CoB--CoM heterodisulfide reductase iron-sulfur subunit A family protein [Elusimicrobiota bacterium]